MNDPVLERRRLCGRQKNAGFSFREGGQIGLVFRRSDQELKTSAPAKPTIDNGIAECNEVLDGSGMYGGFREVRSGVVCGDFLICDNPKLQSVEESGSEISRGAVRVAEVGCPVRCQD